MDGRIVAAWLAASLAQISPAAMAAAPADFVAGYDAKARAADPGFAGASADRGERFFKRVQNGEWSCASCHTEQPSRVGKHARTGRPIEPLAPGVNAARFRDPAKVEKWFRRNCNDLLGRACTDAEKGDVLAWLLTIR